MKAFYRLAAFVLFISLAFQSFAFRAYFDYRVFHAPGQGPYVEFMTSFDGTTFDLASTGTEDSLFQSRVQMTLIVTQASVVKDFRKVIVDGPSVAMGAPADFFSLERFILPNGTYNLEIEIVDLNSTSQLPEKLMQKIVINNSETSPFISDIEFVSAYSQTTDQNAFSKSGYDLIPYLSSYFPSDVKNIIFYSEVYNTNLYPGQDEAFILVTTVVDKFLKEVPDSKRIKRLTGKDAISNLMIADISNLPTGDYKLRLEAFDRSNTSICIEEREFSRNLIQNVPIDQQTVSAETVRLSFASFYTNRDSLAMILQSHLPIAKSQERNTIDNVVPTADLETLQSFFYSFWYRRDQQSPEAAWKKYEQQVKDVQDYFGTRIKKGWQTDRGRVYLQYGKPSTRIVRNNDPDYWPFEIWHYYATNTGLRDRRFLFYNTTLNYDMELLHSDIPNETRNYDWKNLVRSRQMNDPASAGRIGNNQNRDPYSGDELEDLWYNPH